MDLLSGKDASAELTKRLLSAAQAMALKLPESPREATEFVRAVVDRVIIHPDKVRVLFRREALGNLVLSGGSAESHTLQSPSEQSATESIASFELPATVTRSGREIRLILTSDSEKFTSPRHSASLLKAAARAFEWHQQIIHGEECGLTSIAKKSGLNERYVSRIFRLAFLAPDIVQAIVDGSQPHQRNLAKLKSVLPASWAEQRRLLGFPGGRQ